MDGECVSVECYLVKRDLFGESRISVGVLVSVFAIFPSDFSVSPSCVTTRIEYISYDCRNMNAEMFKKCGIYLAY